MNSLEELSYIHLIRQLKMENQKLKDEVIALRKLFIKQRFSNNAK